MAPTAPPIDRFLGNAPCTFIKAVGLSAMPKALGSSRSAIADLVAWVDKKKSGSSVCVMQWTGVIGYGTLM